MSKIGYTFVSKKDGRKYIVADNGTVEGKLTPYARYVWEQANGPIIEPGYEVDHIDDDKTNDNLENLQLLHYIENVAKSRSVTYIPHNCVECGKRFNKTLKEYNKYAKQGKKYEYCGIPCMKPRGPRVSGLSLVSLTCAHCCSDFERRPSHVWRKGRERDVNVYCSTECRLESMRGIGGGRTKNL